MEVKHKTLCSDVKQKYAGSMLSLIKLQLAHGCRTIWLTLVLLFYEGNVVTVVFLCVWNCWIKVILKFKLKFLLQTVNRNTYI